jgi:hypothetical protein
MEIAIHLPDDIAQRVQAQWEDIPRHVLESFVLDGFRARVLTTEDVRRLLGFETKFEVHDFLKEHAVPFYTLADLEHDRETSRRLGL